MTSFDRSPDRLYELLPAFHRTRDIEQGYPLRALLRVINEQVAVVEDDIAQLYDDWFIETCADWAVPYIGDLIGFRPVHEAGEPGDPRTVEGRLRNDFLVPRREVANTIALRRRKGTLHVLEQLANDVAGWPARAVEFYRRLAWTQHLNHQHPQRGCLLDLRDPDRLDRIGAAFERDAHFVDVRRLNSRHRRGRYNIPGIGVYVFRLKSYPVSRTQAYCLEEQGLHCYTFSALGNDAPLYSNDRVEDVRPTSEPGLPLPIRRLALQKIVGEHPRTAAASTVYYGHARSFAIYAPDWPKKGASQPIAASAVVPADLGDWVYQAERNSIAVDPLSGRIAFPAAQLPKKGVWVEYHYGFSADIGGGEYARPAIQPSLQDTSRFQAPDFLDAAALVKRLPKDGDALSVYLRAHFGAATLALLDAYHPPMPVTSELIQAIVNAFNGVLAAADLYDGPRFEPFAPLSDELQQLLADDSGPRLARRNRLLLEAAYHGLLARSFAIYRIGEHHYHKLGAALEKWSTDKPRYAIIEFTDSGVYTDPVRIELDAYQTLQIRAAERKRPVLRMLDYMADAPDGFSISGGTGSRLVLDGLLISGRGIRVDGPGAGDDPAKPAAPDICEIVIRHCTLVPGWGVQCDCEPKRPNEPSIELIETSANLRIEHSIVGSIEIVADARRSDPIAIAISDSIVDATHSGRIALGNASGRLAFARVTLVRSTVLGLLEAHAMDLAENTIFMGCVTIARRQHGCMRFCYVSPNSRTPRRYHCQPDLVRAAVDSLEPAPADAAAAKKNESLRVRPRFTSTRYGTPAYCQLAEDCAAEIKRGADDESEIGVFHDLFQPQREANLRARLAEYTPAGMDAGVLFAS